MWNYHQAVGTEISKAQARVCNNAPRGWKRGEHTWEVTVQDIQSVSGRSLKKLGRVCLLGGEPETGVGRKLASCRLLRLLNFET